VLRLGGEELYRHYLDDRVSGFAVRIATEEMLEVVKWHFMSRDEGEGSLAEKASWQIDEEPEPAEIDSWARGALATRKKPMPTPPATGASVVTESGTRRSKKKEKERRPSTETGKPPGSSGPQSPTAEGSRAPSAATTAKKKDVVKPPPSAAERQRKLVDEAKAKRAAEAKTEADQLSKIKKDLKGKEYTYDRNGAVIVIDEPDASKMPAHSVAPGVNVKSGAHADFGDEMQQLKKMMGEMRPSQSAGDAEKARLAAIARQAEQQPNIIESMDVSEGVTLTSGASTKAGPQRKADPTHMSLKDFQNYGGGSGGGGGGGRGSTAAAPEAAASAPPPPEPEPEPEVVMETGGAANLDGTVPLKDLPPPVKATDRQREEQMGARLRLPRDRPFVNPTLPTRPIMPDAHSNLASNQDTSPVGHRKLPPLEGGNTTKLLNATQGTMPKTVNRLHTVDERLSISLTLTLTLTLTLSFGVTTCMTSSLI
jgi:hypothetical protein